MNVINFNQTGGFPLSTNILDAMQSAYNLLNSFGGAIGDNCIISGCNIVGQNITDGIVIIKGELLPFRGSLFFANSNFAVREDIEERIFEDSKSKQVIHKRYAIITTDTGVAYSQMKRITPLKEIAKAMVPIGVITMWSGEINKIPSGWVLCDGKNGTPNLVDRFIVGAGQKYKVGNTGGLDQVTLTEQQMPSHSHNVEIGNSGNHSHEYQDSYMIEVSGYNAVSGSTRVGPTHRTSGVRWENNPTLYYRNNSTSQSGGHTHSVTVSAKGDSTAHENRPPYYALAYIIYKGE